MRKKQRFSMTTKFIIIMVIVAILVTCLIIGYFSIADLIANISDTETEVIDSLQVVQGFLLVVIFLNISFIIILGIMQYDLYNKIKESEYFAKINNLMTMVDQQKSMEGLEIYNDRLVKAIGSFAAHVKEPKKVYSALYNIYLLKSMKTEADFEKIKMYITILMKAYAENYNLQEVYTDRKIAKIAEAAAFYDIGKLGTPGHILYKESNLNEYDYKLAKEHAEVGFNIVEAIKPDIEMGTFEQYFRDIAGFHHERFDGTGYPRGLKGEEIPFIARIVALVTTYDTVTRDRPYSKAMSHLDAVALINEEKNNYFDPKIVKVFNSVENEFNKIHDRKEL